MPTSSIETRLCSGAFACALARSSSKWPMPEAALVLIEDVGLATAYLATDAAKLMTGEILYIDGGYHIMD